MDEEEKKESKEEKQSEFEIRDGVLKKYRGKGGRVFIPEGVTSIDWDAFTGCYTVTSVVIPNTVTSIKAWAFKYCYSILEVFIPNSVISISDEAFLKCPNVIIYCEAESRPEGWSQYWNLYDYDEHVEYCDILNPSEKIEETQREYYQYCIVKWGYKFKK